MSIKNKVVFYSTQNKILEKATDKDELEEIAKRAGLVYPTEDIAIFKCVYACLEKPNKNGAVLPTEEVAKSLDTLKGKPVNINHIRPKTVGHWLYAEIQDNQIIAFGAFWKDIFSKEYADFKERTEKGTAKVSFELRRTPVIGEQKPFKCIDIEFFGGAVLEKDVSPAEDNASILEFATQDVIEQAKYYDFEFDKIMDLTYRAICPSCDKSTWKDLMSVDFEKDKVVAKCGSCGDTLEIELLPNTKVIKKNKNKDKAQESAKIMDEKELLSKINELETAIKTKNEEIAKKDVQISEITKKVEESAIKFEDLNKKIETIAQETASKVEKARKDAITITERRTELADFAKDVKDEDILDEKEYTILKQQKAIAELQKNIEIATKNANGNQDIVKGSKKEETASTEETKTKVSDLSEKIKSWQTQAKEIAKQSKEMDKINSEKSE